MSQKLSEKIAKLGCDIALKFGDHSSQYEDFYEIINEVAPVADGGYRHGVGLKRYWVDDMSGDKEESPDGSWVRYEDAAAALSVQPDDGS